MSDQVAAIAKGLSVRLLKDLSVIAVSAAEKESAALGVATKEVFSLITSERMVELFSDSVRDAIKALSGDDYAAIVSADAVTWEDNR